MFVVTKYNNTIPSLIPIDYQIKKIKEKGSFAILVDDNFSGVPAFYKTCKKHQVMPIIGLSVDDKNLPFSFVVVSKNSQGYQHLCKISHANIDIFEHVINNPLFNILLYNVKPTEMKGAYEKILNISNIYGGMDFLDNDSAVWIWNNSPKNKIVPFSTPRFSTKNEFIGLKGILAIKNKKKYSDISTASLFQHKQYDIENIKTQNNLSLKDYSEGEFDLSIQNFTNDIIDDYLFDKPKIPNFVQGEHLQQFKEKMKKRYPNLSQEISKVDDAKSMLRLLTLIGIKEKKLISIQEYTARLKKEISIIEQMNFAGYFCICYDIVNIAKENNIAIGPGRGSAAGSLVSYLLGITSIDPVKHNLLFERFLNTKRSTIPDIDIDVDADNREILIDLIQQKYGYDNIAGIKVFQTIGVKSAFIDASRILDIEKNVGEKLASIAGKYQTMDKAIKEKGDFLYSKCLQNNTEELMLVAPQIYGLIKSSSMSASSIIISEKSIQDIAPTSVIDEKTVVAYSGENIEFGNMVKFDILPLKTLSIIRRTLQAANEKENESIDYTDPNVFTFMIKDNLDGIFQLESSGMKQLVKKIKPKTIDDIAILISLYRPGVLQSNMIDEFIKRRNNNNKFDFQIPEFKNPLRKILEPTCGIIVYQEQIMEIVKEIGGFNLFEADMVRRAMAKKDESSLHDMKNLFIEGATKQGYSEKSSELLFKTIEGFAGYGFNKSHAYAYAYITYQTAYLKFKYHNIFMSNVLNSTSDSHKKTKYLCNLLQGTSILFPSINHSMYGSFSDNDKIVLGLNLIKGIPSDEAISISKNKPYSSLKDFVIKNKEIIERRGTLGVRNLILAGALNCFSEDKLHLLKIFQEEINLNVPHVKNILESNIVFNFFAEKESIGIPLHDPFEKINNTIQDLQIPSFSDLSHGHSQQSSHMVLGFVYDVKERTGKDGSPYFEISIYYNRENISLYAFDKESIDVFKSMINFDSNGGFHAKPLIFGVKTKKNNKGIWHTISFTREYQKKNPNIFTVSEKNLYSFFEKKETNNKNKISGLLYASQSSISDQKKKIFKKQ